MNNFSESTRESCRFTKKIEDILCTLAGMISSYLGTITILRDKAAMFDTFMTLFMQVGHGKFLMILVVYLAL